MRTLLPVLAAALLSAPGRAQEWAKKALEASPRHGEWVEVKSGTRTLSAFVVYPEVKTKAPAIVVIHEIFGLTDWARGMADELAAQGYVAIAPALAPGTFPDVDSARKAVGALDPEAVAVDLDAVADYVKSLPASDGRVSVIGFCWGGGQAFRYAAHRDGLRAAFVFYGPPPPDLKAVKAPVYGFYAENDARIGATLPETEKGMKAAGKSFDPVTYAGAGHGFMRGGEDPQGRPEDRKAREKAWKRLKKLLAR